MADAVDMLWVSDGLPPQHEGEHVVGEVYSPPRIVPVARAAGLPGGWSLDILTENAWGQNWDFDDPTMRQQAKKLVIETKPWVLIGSPMCTWFCTLMKLNKARMDPAKYEAERNRAIGHLRFMVELFQLQLDAGRYVLFEHPAGADSWDLDFVRDLLDRPGMTTIVTHMC